MHSSHRQFGWYNLLVVLGISLSSLSFGYSAAVIGTITGQPTFLEYFKLTGTSNGDELLGACVCMYYVGGFFGSIYGAWASDYWGRKNSQIQAAIIVAVSGALQAGSVHVAMFIVGRFLCGIAGYMVLTGTPAWMAELVPPRQRGQLMDTHTVVLIAGYFATAWVGYGFYFYSGSVPAFRPILAIQCAPPVFFLAVVSFLPESPRWLILRNQGDAAHRILRQLHSTEAAPGSLSLAEIEYQQITRQIELERGLDTSFLGMWRSGWPNRKRIIFAVVWPFMTVGSGILVIANYGPLLYSSLGYGSAKQLLFNGIWMSVTWFANICAPFLIDRFPRPGYAATGLAGCFATLVAEAAIIKNIAATGSDNRAGLEAGVAMFFIYAWFYGSCLDGMLFVWIGEAFPTPLRSNGYLIAMVTHALANTAWLGAAPTAFATVGWQYYLPFIIISGLAMIIVFFFFPNTRHLALEEIGAIFGDADHVAVYQQDILDEGTHELHIVSKDKGDE
ncbi:uncharacterized protein PV07_08778 [Cladophialophora immunda]|uniref:Major facilitator superfamily (MFS) profile domain-containing protein n=1 Tax=Cladophialophora immunda TaxID=569365 RepID=A0A0D2AKV6_9EURO|nr:uncharacterized protein PV07_08778 [Cladophialophora immunda]KIW25612.1 hypothetical protein PV07_08778 [Cladophialophora immunda]